MQVPDTDRTVADAIDRVLEAEQAAAAALTVAETAGRAVIDAAREQRRSILERTRQRITRMHERAETQLAARLAQLEAMAGAADRDSTVAPDAARRALAGVAARLSGGAAP
jgi:hypothetical protein